MIPIVTDEATAAAFDAAHERLGFTPLCERLERLLIAELDDKRPHVLRRHYSR